MTQRPAWRKEKGKPVVRLLRSKAAQQYRKDGWNVEAGLAWRLAASGQIENRSEDAEGKENRREATRLRLGHTRPNRPLASERRSSRLGQNGFNRHRQKVAGE